MESAYEHYLQASSTRLAMRVRLPGNTQKSCCPLGTPSLFQWTLDISWWSWSVVDIFGFRVLCLSQFPTQLSYAQLVRQWSCTRRCGATSKRRHWGWWRWELTIRTKVMWSSCFIMFYPYHLYLSLPGQRRSTWQQFAKCSHFGAGRKWTSPADCCHFAFIFSRFVLMSWCLHRRLGSCTTPQVLPGWVLRFTAPTGHTYNKLGFKRQRTASTPNSFIRFIRLCFYILHVFVLWSCPFFFNDVSVRLALFSYQAVVDLYIGKGWSSDHVAMQLKTLRPVKLWNIRASTFDMAGFTSLTTFISRWHDKHLASIPAVWCGSDASLGCLGLFHLVSWFQDWASKMSLGPKISISQRNKKVDMCARIWQWFQTFCVLCTRVKF